MQWKVNGPHRRKSPISYDSVDEGGGTMLSDTYSMTSCMCETEKAPFAQPVRGWLLGAVTGRQCTVWCKGRAFTV